MKHLVGIGIGQDPVFDYAEGKLTFSGDLKNLKLENILLIVNINKNKIIHSQKNSLLQGTLTPDGSTQVYSIANYNNADYLNDGTQEFHVWIETDDGSNEIDFISAMALKAQSYALATDLKLEAGGNINFSFDPTNLENNIVAQTGAINNMKTSIDKLLEIPDTAILQPGGSTATYTITQHYPNGELMVSVRNLDENDAAITLKLSSSALLSAHNLKAGEYIDIKFDEIDVPANAILQVTFKEQL